MNDIPSTLLSLPQTLRRFFAYASPRILLAQLVIAGAARSWLGPIRAADGWLIGAIALYWPLQEWLLHRVLLHARPRTLFDNAAARAHRQHHRDPRDLAFALLPAASFRLLVPVHLAFWAAATRSLPLASTGIAAFSAATLFYEWIHFLCHAPYRPRGAHLRRVRAQHALHHFKNEHYWFAFTVPAIDRLLGTGPDPSRVQPSESCRALGGDE